MAATHAERIAEMAQWCSICHLVIDKDATGDDAAQFLACVHPFHKYCIEQHPTDKKHRIQQYCFLIVLFLCLSALVLIC